MALIYSENITSGDEYSHVVGLQTGAKTKVLDGSATATWITTTTYYDNRVRPIQIIADIYGVSGGKLYVSTKYDFTGNILQTRERHDNVTTTPDVLNTLNTYDVRGRLLTTSSSLNTTTPTNMTYTYDELGRLATKKYGNNIETETYAHNIRGWLTEKNASRFSMKLRYNDIQRTSAGNAVYNGNISEWDWKTTTSAWEGYSLRYDKLNRLLSSGQFSQKGSTWTSTNKFTEHVLKYDLNGNIKSLRRNSNGSLLNNYTYNYTGNQLTTLSGVSGNYLYDKNGNMTKDGRKNLEIKYNSLNLLSEVKQGSALKAKYIYAADGTKLAVSDAVGNGYCYRGSLIYKSTGGVCALESAAFSDGRIVRSTAGYVTNYNITDHLGSVRVVFDGSGTVLETNDYYAFGGRHAVAGSLASDNRFKFNGKELQTTGDLGYLDYGARMYDDVIGRWFGMDPMAEDFYDITPYSYCFNNPINFVDMFGLYPEDPGWKIDYGSVTIRPEGGSSGSWVWMGPWLATFKKENRDNEVNSTRTDIERFRALITYQKGEKVLPKIEGFFETFGYYLLGRTHNGYQVNQEGRLTGLKLVTGMAPTPGKFKGGSLFIKGTGKVARGVFHSQTKKAILDAAGKSNFIKIVGRNPNIEINKTGEIILKGVQKDGFAGKIYNTGLKAKDFF